MPAESGLPAAVLVIWAVTLAVAVAVVLPVAWYLLHRTLLAARSIERYAADTLEAGAGIARHTAAIASLQTTVRVAQELLAGAGAIARSTEAIEQALGRRTLGRGGP